MRPRFLAYDGLNRVLIGEFQLTARFSFPFPAFPVHSTHCEFMTTSCFLPPSFVFLAALAGLTIPGHGADLRSDLERTYRSWAAAITQRSLPLWEEQTAAHRQVITHNFVVSRKAKWPDAIFDLPFRLPEIATLSHLATFEKGDTANIIYYGKVDFGLLEGSVPSNVLVLKFAREKGVWKFDNTRFFNLDADPAVRQLIANDELDFLNDPEFQPTGEVPPVPRLISGFDHPGEIWIASIGYETTVTIGDLHSTKVGDNIVTDVVIGGLARSGLPVTVQAKELPLPPGGERRLQVEIYALRRDKPAVKVWEYRPALENALAPYAAKVYANAVTMQDE